MSSKKGFIRLVIIITIFLITLSMMGVSLRELAKDALFRDNVAFAWHWAGEQFANLWQTYGTEGMHAIKENIRTIFGR